MKNLNRLIVFGDKLIDIIFENKIAHINEYKDYYVEERNFIISNFTNIPDFLKQCRTYNSLITYFISLDNDPDTWKHSARIYINEQFSDFLNFIEFGNSFNNESTISEANFSDSTISIILQKKVFNHIKSLLENGHYFNAVEESYKIVREKLKEITGKEKAHEGFKKDNYEIIFGHKPQNDAEKDFFEGVKFLHMAIQNLRNEKAHTPAQELDKNLAIHYIVLASLAYDLINKNV
jgi:uncharacterized protein (TIGR02391 family)